MEEKINIHAFRLKPGDDLKTAIQKLVLLNGIQAGWVISCVGSLTQYCLRFANQANESREQGFYEIISLSGTLSIHGSHLHLGIADNKGKMTGGHLLEGCLVYTTAEVIIGETLQLSFTRAKDGSTAWNELQISKKPTKENS
jgi:predicted DNA-binding protein with PD1-like motif